MPSFYALALFKNLQDYSLLDANITGQQISIKSYNYVYAAQLPVVNALAMKKNNMIDMILVNKSKASKSVEIILQQNGTFSNFSQTSYSANTAFPTGEYSIAEKTQTTGTVQQNTIIITMPKLSFAKITIN